jgi:translation initiation factor IF-2
MDATRMAALDDPLISSEEVPVGSESEASNRTVFSSQAALIADLVRDKFSSRFFGRSPFRVLRIDEPEGPSTAGGRLARQNISLVAQQGSAPSIVCGWVDVSKKEAQLRSYESVSRRHEARHGQKVELGPEHYERFLNDLVDTLLIGGIRVRILVPDEQEGGATPAPAPVPQAPKRASVSLVMAFLLMVLAFGLGFVARHLAGNAVQLPF